MKQCLRFVAALVCQATALQASAYDFEAGGVYYNVLQDDLCEVTYATTAYNSYSGTVAVPAYVTHESKWYKVARIGESAFRYCSALTTVTLTRSIEQVSDNAFDGCSALTSLTYLPTTLRLYLSENAANLGIARAAQEWLGHDVQQYTTLPLVLPTDEVYQRYYPNFIASDSTLAYPTNATLQACNNSQLHHCVDGTLLTDVTGTILRQTIEAQLQGLCMEAETPKAWIYGADDTSPSQFNNREKQKQYEAQQVGDYMLFNGIANNSTSTQFSYYLPPVLSGMYYNVYCVFAMPTTVDDPYYTEDSELPCKFRAYLHKLRYGGSMTTGTGSTSRILNPATGERDLIGNGTVCLLKGYQFGFCTTVDDNNPCINFTSYVSNSENQKTYTRRMRIDKFIVRAFATEAEAEADYQSMSNQ